MGVGYLLGIMKIGSYICCGLALLGGFCWAQEERDPFAPQEPAPKPVVPHRGVVALPKSIKYEQLDKNRHQYSITGLYPKEEKDVKSFEEHCVDLFKLVLPEGAEVEAQLKGETLMLMASQQIPHDTLAFVVDGVALGGGWLPCWSELEARDLKRANHFNPELYEIVQQAGDFPPGLAWVGLGDKELRFPFLHTVMTATGTFLIGPTTGRCMCHSRFALRVLDDQGDLLWIADDPASGLCRFASGDKDADGCHELYFETDDHGKTTRYVVRPK